MAASAPGTSNVPCGGGGSGVRVALVDTGAGLRFTVALDQGGDIVDASYNQFGLAYLSPNGLRPPSHAFHFDNDWLSNWPAVLVTTCGPEYIGGSRIEQGIKTSLHGRYSNTPAMVEYIRNPDPRRGELRMEVGLLVRDTRMFGPVFQVRRTLRCTLGRPEIEIEDEVANHGDTPVPHHWLYHCNLGYPLLDEGGRFIYRGAAEYWQTPPPPGRDIVQPLSTAAMNGLKRVPEGLPEHVGGGERGLVVTVDPDSEGTCRVGLINDSLPLGLELSYPARALPRMAHWQHFGPLGSYATALEPFMDRCWAGPARNPLVDATLAPDESRSYRLRFRILASPEEIEALAAHDGDLRASS